jgi:hypothetical protein
MAISTNFSADKQDNDIVGRPTGVLTHATASAGAPDALAASASAPEAARVAAAGSPADLKPWRWCDKPTQPAGRKIQPC